MKNIYFILLAIIFVNISCSNNKDCLKLNYQLNQRCLVTTLREANPTPTVDLVKVELEVKNICDDVIKFIKLNTPFELMMVNGGIFEVLNENGKNVRYNGMMSYMEPLESCVSQNSASACYFQSIWPGNNPVWAVVDLTKGYTFNPGIYKVRFLGANATGLPPSEFITIKVIAVHTEN